MNGVHDLGGTDGLGPVVVPEGEPVFRAEWEKAAFAMFSMCFRAGFFGVDEFRYGIEQIHPAVYLLSPTTSTGSTPWNTTAGQGLLDLDELDRRTQYYLEHPDAPLPERERSRSGRLRRGRGPGRRARQRVRQGPASRWATVRPRRQPERTHPAGALHPRPHRGDRARPRQLHLPRQRGQRRR